MQYKIANFLEKYTSGKTEFILQWKLLLKVMNNALDMIRTKMQISL